MKNKWMFFLYISIFLYSCGGSNKQESVETMQNNQIATTEFLKGKQIYELRCANCHKKNGNGMGGLYPPISGSDYLVGHFDEVVCLIKKGSNAPLVVNGKEYKMPMPPHSDLSKVEISDLMNYIMNAWSNKLGPVTTRKVSNALKKCN